MHKKIGQLQFVFYLNHAIFITSVFLSIHNSSKVVKCSIFIQAIDPNSELVCIHDSARPLVLAGDVQKVGFNTFPLYNIA